MAAQVSNVKIQIYAGIKKLNGSQTDKTKQKDGHAFEYLKENTDTWRNTDLYLSTGLDVGQMFGGHRQVV